MRSIDWDDDGHPVGYERLVFVSVFDGWLKPEEVSRLEEIEPEEWQRFWHFSDLLAGRFTLWALDKEAGSMRPFDFGRDGRSGWYSDEGGSWGGHFSPYDPAILYVAELDCVIEEHFDYTSLVWHRDEEAISALRTAVEEAGLYVFGR